MIAYMYIYMPVVMWYYHRIQVAATDLAMIKVAVPNMTQAVVDRAIQVGALWHTGNPDILHIYHIMIRMLFSSLCMKILFIKYWLGKWIHDKVNLNDLWNVWWIFWFKWEKRMMVKGEILLRDHFRLWVALLILFLLNYIL
jgi:hypothetical protein